MKACTHALSSSWRRACGRAARRGVEPRADAAPPCRGRSASITDRLAGEEARRVAAPCAIRCRTPAAATCSTAAARRSGEALPAVARVLGWSRGRRRRSAPCACCCVMPGPARRGRSARPAGGTAVDAFVEMLRPTITRTARAAIAALGRLGSRRATARSSRCSMTRTTVDRGVRRAGAHRRSGGVRTAARVSLGTPTPPSAWRRSARSTRSATPRCRRGSELLGARRPAGAGIGGADCRLLRLSGALDAGTGLRADPVEKRCASPRSSTCPSSRTIGSSAWSPPRWRPKRRRRGRPPRGRSPGSRRPKRPGARLMPCADDPDHWVRYFAARELGERPARRLPAGAARPCARRSRRARSASRRSKRLAPAPIWSRWRRC